MNNKGQGIVVLGFPRSGTTLIRRILDAHPNIACPGETYLLRAAARFLEADELIHGAAMGVIDGLAFAGFTENDVYERLRAFVTAFHSENATRQGKVRWAEKSAADVFYLRHIEKLFVGHVQFICVFRHGLDVACSNLELAEKNHGYIDELLPYVRRNKRPLLAMCEAWVEMTESLMAFADRNSQSSFVYRYEDLIAGEEATLTELFQFLGEHPSMAAEALSGSGNIGFGDWKTYASSSVNSASVNRWASLPGELAGEAGQIINPTLEKLGYDAVPLLSVKDSEEARRKYQLGLLGQSTRPE